jgi:NADH-quinone oxidoreductase subunit M
VNEVLWAAQAGYPPLATLQWLPLAAAVLLMIMREDDLALVLGRLFAVAELVVAIDLYARIDVTTAMSCSLPSASMCSPTMPRPTA